MPSVAILAGGRAVRFGGTQKGSLLVGGQSILERQVSEIGQLTDDIMLIGGVAPEGLGVRVIADRRTGCGPLGGLDAALAAARDDIVAVVAGDMPFVSGAFLAALIEHLNDHPRETGETVRHGSLDAVVPRDERGYHPLCAVYSRSCHPAVERRLAAGQLALSALVEDAQLHVRFVEPHEMPAFDYDRVLTNVNTPADYRLLS